MNEFIIIGKALEAPEAKTAESGTNYAQMLIGVKRPFKNRDGSIDDDIIQVTMFNACAEEAIENVKKDSAVMIKGHISSSSYVKDDRTIYTSSNIADRVSVLSQIL